MASQVTKFVQDLKSRNVDIQIKTARELYHYAKTELREVPQEELTQFLDEFNHQIFEMVSSNDVHEKKGGVLAIGMYLMVPYSHSIQSFLQKRPYRADDVCCSMFTFRSQFL